MGPMFNVEWSPYEIMAAKSVIARHNPDNNYADETNKKHNAIVNDLQGSKRCSPGRQKSQVTKLYIQLVAEMTQAVHIGNHSTVAINNLVSENLEIQVEDPPMDSMDMLLPNQTYEMAPEATRMMEEAPQQQVINPHQEVQKKTGIWTKEEHRQFLCGLSLLGRGKWKEISRDYVRTRTPAQISSHAQKYFHRKECTSKKRYSIIDVSLFDDEPWMQNNYAFSQDVPTPGGAHNPNWFGSSSQLDNMNSHAQVWSPFLYNAGQESSNKQVSTWTDQHVGASSSLAPALEETGSHMAWNGNQQGNFIPEEWMDIGNMY
ncbi:unnamed protein product [Urochloa humidicola]